MRPAALGGRGAWPHRGCVCAGLIVLVLREDVLHLLAGAEQVALVEALPPLLHKDEDAGKLVVLKAGQRAAESIGVGM